MSIDLLNTCASCVYAHSGTDEKIYCDFNDNEEVNAGHTCSAYKYDSEIEYKARPSNWDMTCEDCDHYEPDEGVCKLDEESRQWGESMRGRSCFDRACDNFKKRCEDEDSDDDDEPMRGRPCDENGYLANDEGEWE